MLPIERRRSDLNARPLLEPIRNALDVRLLIHLQVPKPLALFAPLAKDDRVVPVLGEALDKDGDFLAAPCLGGACRRHAVEAAHDVCVVRLGWSGVPLPVEAGRGDFGSDGVGDTLVEPGEGVNVFGVLLLCHGCVVSTWC